MFTSNSAIINYIILSQLYQKIGINIGNIGHIKKPVKLKVPTCFRNHIVYCVLSLLNK